jgi:hypothetical protein
VDREGTILRADLSGWIANAGKYRHKQRSGVNGYNAGQVRGRFGESIVANGGTSLPAVQHDYAGDRVQRVSGIFPDDAVSGGICVDVDRE